jgi:very-short-patch-repair endonuclease
MVKNLRTCCEKTSLEQVLFNLLESRNIKFVEQYPTRSGFVLDFVIPPNFVLEADGPCHDSSKSKRRDKFRDKILKIEGWKIYRIHYKYFYDLDILNKKIDKILGEINGP